MANNKKILAYQIIAVSNTTQSSSYLNLSSTPLLPIELVGKEEKEKRLVLVLLNVFSRVLPTTYSSS